MRLSTGIFAALLGLFAACGSGDDAPARTIEPLATDQQQPIDIAVSGTKVFWLSGVTRGKVLSLPKSGGDPTVLTEADSPHAIAVSDDFVYFGESTSALKRVNIGGGNASSVALQNVTDVALGSQRAFGVSAETHELWSVPLQGGALYNINDFTLVEEPSALVVDESEVFWINRLQGEIAAFSVEIAEEPGVARVVANFPGDNTTQLLGQGTDLFWPDHSTGEILSVAKSGGEPTVIAEAVVQYLVADATHLYYSGDKGGDLQIRRVPIGGGESEVLVDLDEMPGGLALDATHVYWTSPIAGTVQAIAKEL